MATVIRVKRKLVEEPSDALLVTSKRRKVCQDDPLTTIVKFVATVDKQDNSALEKFTETLSKDVLKTTYKRYIGNVLKKNRENTKKQSNEGRYKIVNSMRSLETSKTEQLADVINVIDLEDVKAISSDQANSSYVYDLYYTQANEALHLENLESILPLEDLVFEDPREEEDECNYESDDSNSESNWRNDYPDSDHLEDSDDEFNLNTAMKNLKVRHDLSSDDDFVYGLEDEDLDTRGSDSDEDGSDPEGDLDDYYSDEE